MKAILHKFPYSYMDYENQLLLREINSLFPNAAMIENRKSHIVLDNLEEGDICNIEKLTYIAQFEIEDRLFYTLQYKFESSCTGENIKRQSTRYSTHGMHEYKGKYNPQIVHALLNIFGIDDRKSVLDPFCGSGTTMLECLHLGISSTGTDINPFAVFLSNAKLHSIQLDCEKVKADFALLKEKLLNTQEQDMVLKKDKRTEYLKKWVPINELILLEKILLYTESFEHSSAEFFRVTASDLIRDYSLQEPSDLRIRRRISPYPEVPLIEAWGKNVEKYLKNILSIQKVCISNCAVNQAINVDIKNVIPNETLQSFDIAITSPPYATALPYIDTQRISLVWLGLCPPDEIMLLESNLIGSRELYKTQKKDFYELMISNQAHLPKEIFNLIEQINNCLSEKDGFRKQAVPTLLYRYFCDMKQMFIRVNSLIRSRGHYCLIVGHNKTTVSNTTFHLDTPKLLSILAESCGWIVNELLPLQTYKRYGLNSKNSINHETLIILQKAE